MPKTPIWVRMYRNTKWSEQGKICYYCKSKVILEQITADHLVPKSKNGSDNEENIVAACSKCNCFKGDSSYKQFLKKAARVNNYKDIHKGMLGAVVRVQKRGEIAVYNIKRYTGTL